MHGHPENGTDPLPEDSQQHVELNSLFNAYYSIWNRNCCQKFENNQSHGGGYT
jgi:hypothetical protein